MLAALRDKDVAGMIAALLPIARRFVLPHARNERAFPPDELANVIRAAAPACNITILPTFATAFEQARATESPILITGSLHFAGEALAALSGNPDDLEDCSQ